MPGRSGSDKLFARVPFGIGLRIVRWPLSLLIASWAVKITLIGLRVTDGGGASLFHPLAPVALLFDDLWLVGGFGALVGLSGWFGQSSLAAGPPVQGGLLWVLYAALTLWMAFNIPVARQLSTPMTYAFVHAVGGALGDSISTYATPVNIFVPTLVWIAALPLPHFVRGRVAPTRRQSIVGGALGALLLAGGPYALTQVDTLGLHRNAVVALVQTTWRQQGKGPLSFPSQDSPECRSTQDATGPTLSDLVGIARDRNIVWVILESFRARALRTYGAQRAATPHLDALATQAVVFENAYAAYPESIKGLFSMLCGRTPPVRTEASQYGVGLLPCASIAMELGAAGYQTALFHSGWFAYLGMDAVVEGRGFTTLVDAATVTSPYRSSFGVDDRSTAARLLKWVDGIPSGQRFFAVFMPIAGHHPYHAAGDVRRPFPETSAHDEYLNDVHTADDAFGQLRAGLKTRGLDDDTVYVVFGDHGEAFAEHEGNVAHALFLYEENLRVPLFLAAPGRFDRRRKISTPVSLIDLAPTTLALAGRNLATEHEGHSLLGGPPRVVRFFTEQGIRRAGLRDDRWKLILDLDSNRTQLFDLGADPEERTDLSTAHPDVVARYRDCLRIDRRDKGN